MKPLRILSFLGAGLLATAAWGVEPLRMDVDGTYSGAIPDTSVVTVSLENDGPDARGAVRVSGQNGETIYPVDLPRGARKKLLTLPDVPWGEVVFTLETDHGDVTRKIMAVPPPSESGMGSVLLIGDDNGSLGFLRKLTDGKERIATRDAYVKAEDTPDRRAAFRTMNVVMLGPGAERLSDGSVRALKDFALSGGSLIFLGGPSAPILEDRRWAELLPGRGWRPKTVGSSPVLAKLAGDDLPGPFTVLSPDVPAPGANIRWEGGAALEIEKGYGLGRVVVLGYSPLEPPLSTWSGRARLISRFVRPGEGQRSKSFIASYQVVNNLDNYYPGATPAPYMVRSTSGAMVPSSSPYAVVPAVPQGDPFSTKLPPTATVFGILAGYFVLVVPVSFLVLRKLKKGEMAWFTAPVLSLAFAGLLFKSAQGLYSASLSTATNGVVILQEGSPDAMFFGTSQMFFPRGGTYDLKLEGVDRMTAVDQNEYYGFGSRPSSALAGFNPVDVGEIKVPQLEAENLAFRDLSYAQRFDANGWFRFDKVDGQHLRIENLSPYPFSGSLANGQFESANFAIPPGGRKLVEIGSGETVPSGTTLTATDLRNFTRGSHRIALHGRISGFRPGPQIGQEVADRSGVTVVAFAQGPAQ